MFYFRDSSNDEDAENPAEEVEEDLVITRPESRTKTVSETTIATDSSQDSPGDTDQLTMAELELLKKLEEANRFVCLNGFCNHNNN